MKEEDRLIWIQALKEELDALCKMNVKEDLTKTEVYERYWSKNRQDNETPVEDCRGEEVLTGWNRRTPSKGEMLRMRQL